MPYKLKSCSFPLRLPSEITRNQLLHDLVCTAVYALNAGVGPHLADGVFLHKAVATVQLKAFVEDFALGVSEPVFRHGGAVDGQLSAQVFRDALVEEGAGDCGFGFALRQFEACVLELGEGAAEGFALLAVLDRARDCALHGTHRFAADDQALLRELLHHLVKAFALFST